MTDTLHVLHEGRTAKKYCHMCTYNASEKDWHLHTSRTLQAQAPHKASHEGRREEHLRQGRQSGSETGKEGRQSLPSGSLEAADLDSPTPGGNDSTSRGQLMWE